MNNVTWRTEIDEEREFLRMNSTQFWDVSTLQLSYIEEEVLLTPRKLIALREARDRIHALLR
jgi:hypothetical protein